MAESIIKDNPFIKDPDAAFATGLNIYKGFKELTAPDIDYEVFRLQSEYKQNQAANIELEAQQDANLLREQFNEAVGTYKYGAARRGVKVGVGSSSQNIEKSAIALEEDIQTIKGSAKFKADQMRSVADRYKTAAKGAREVSKWSKIAKGLTSLSKAKTSYDIATKKKKKEVK